MDRFRRGQLQGGVAMINNERVAIIQRLLNDIRQRGFEKATEDITTLLEAVEMTVDALKVRYRHYGPLGELRVEPDEWVKADDVLSAINIALHEGLLRDIFDVGRSKEDGS
jgi:hypothetical protein